MSSYKGSDKLLMWSLKGELESDFTVDIARRN